MGIRGYATALLTAPLLVAAVLLGLSSISSEFLPGIVTRPRQGRIAAVRHRVGARRRGLLEELGWTGFAVPTLRRRHGPVATGLIVGFLWGVWHYLISFWASGTSTGALSLTQFLPGMVFYVASLPAYRVLMVWLHDRTKSLPLAMLMHASFSASMLILQPPIHRSEGGDDLESCPRRSALATVGAVALIRRGHLSRQPLRSLPLQEVSS